MWIQETVERSQQPQHQIYCNVATRHYQALLGLKSLRGSPELARVLEAFAALLSRLKEPLSPPSPVRRREFASRVSPFAA